MFVVWIRLFVYVYYFILFMYEQHNYQVSYRFL